jgi:ParB family transcriptional regulator, chromosome partitioning protein
MMPGRSRRDRARPAMQSQIDASRGESSAQLIEHLKKGDMAREAERLLEGTGWLPEPLRLAETEPVTGAATSEAEALPEFLAEDGEAQADAEEDQPHIIAAE